MNQYAFWTTLLLDVVVKVALLLLIVWVGSLFIRKRSAAAQHRWWTLGFVGCLLIPVITLVTPTWTLPILSGPSETAAPSSPNEMPLVSNRTLVNRAPSGMIESTIPRELTPQPLQVLDNEMPKTSSEQPIAAAPTSADKQIIISMANMLLIVWIVGIAVCWLRSVWQHILLKRLLNDCFQLENPQWHELLSKCSELLEVKQEVALLRHPSALSPVSSGLLRQAVILPEDAENWDVDRSRLVLLHELAHVQRRDVLTQTLAGLACGLYWFNPLCWYGLSQMRRFRELACDDLVLSCEQWPSRYADVLLGIARSYRHQSYSTAVGMAHNTNVESRIMAILDKTRRRVSLSRTAARLLLVSAAALVCLVGTAQLRSQAEPSTNAAGQEKSAEQEAVEKPKQVTKEPIHITIVIAQHLMLLEGREVISWEQLDKKFAALPDDALVHPDFYFTNGAYHIGRYEQSKDKMWELHRKYQWHGRSEGSLWPSAGARYDRFKTADDLAPDETRRLDVLVVDHEGKSVTDAEVLLMPPVDESVSFKEHHLTLVEGRVNNRIAYEMTQTDEKGQATLYPQQEDYYLVALHPSGGFVMTQSKYIQKEPKVTLQRWAALASKLELKPGEKQHASLSTKVPESPGLPIIVFQQHLESDKVEDEAELFGFTHVPPMYNTTIQRSFPHPKDGSAISLPGATVSLLPGEKRQLGLGPLSDAQREQLENMRRRSEERRKKFERELEEQVSSGAEQSSHEMQIRILDDAGNPLAGAKLYSNRVRPQGVEGDRIVNTDLVADEAGEITLPIDRNRDTVKLWAWAPGKVSEFVWLNRGPEQMDALLPLKYEFRLSEGTSIGGRVVDGSGVPIKNVHVRVQVTTAPYDGNDSVNAEPRVNDWLTDSFKQPKVTTDSNGRWQIDNAPSPINGQDYEFRIKLDHPDYTGDSNWGGLQAAQGVTTEQFRAGNAKIVMSRGTHIEGTVVDREGKPITQGWFVWHDEPYFTQGTWEARLDQQGSFKTPQLDPGEHPIIIIAPGFAAQRRVVNVEPGLAPLRFELKPGNRTEIRFVDTDGNPIPKASVYLGAISDSGTWNGSNALHSQGSPGAEYGIPRRADKQGRYAWNWAPDGAVRYHVGAKGFAGKTVSLVPKSEPHVITLADARIAAGRVTDAMTGKPISKFLAMPVIVFRPNHYSTRFTDRKAGVDGRYELPLTGSGNPEDHYRVRFEAGGYRSIVSEESFGPLDGLVELNVQLEPASVREGRVVGPQGNPISGAQVIEGTSTWVPGTRNGEPNSYGERIVLTDKDGRFELNATNELVRVRVLHDSGIVEKLVVPEDSNIGELELQPWASVSGSLIQDGQPIADQWINFSLLVRSGLGEARFQDSYGTSTDTEGRFEMKRLPPGTGSLQAYLGPWEDSPLTSGESLTLELKPGENRSVVLGGKGAVLSGQVVATGRDDVPLDRKWSLNYLVSRNRGVQPPYTAGFPKLSFNPSEPMQPAWSLDPHFNDWLRTRENHFVKLTPDGKLRVTGVEPGEYDLVIRLYEQPAGCLVETVGEKIVPVRVEGEGEINLGQIEVPCRAGPRVGSDMRAFEFVDIAGRKQSVNDLSGQYVLMHVWASWCAPCLESMPDLQATTENLADRPVTFVGLNVDQHSGQASDLAQRKGWHWSQNYLGEDSDMARQLAISSVPTYYLIGPDGILAASATEWSKIKRELLSSLNESGQ